ncbi:hypothetical protein DEU56DRAFT_810812 [Suillus clintonianus]|uniref:uncharacterized protein n=1 Tax=Suillus clintonianus TaxID=1904413 RepID=UPI001B86533E|nr:uncharacterized protein DEU56DRAFT_810812 [Suillus clintonianus]KAG2133293.1 hypothetical protein DEU56DRAFT_810812 [Suillus clintonianus]
MNARELYFLTCIVFARASLKRTSRTRTRKNSISIPSDAGCPLSHSTHTRPLPLQIIPELSENDFEFDSTPLSVPQPDVHLRPSPRVTLSAFAFSIDDALLMLNEEPRSPALSASSSTDDSNTSGEMPATPGVSDDEDICELRLPSPRLRPKRITIRPLCITKTRSIVCADEDDVAEVIEKDTDAHSLIEGHEEQEDEYDFYTRQFQDFISLYSPLPSPAPVSAPPTARPDSVILSPEVAPKLPVEAPKPRGRSRFSKALPLLPLPTPPPSSAVPPVPQLPVSVSAVRRKRVIPPVPMYPPPPPPINSRPPPRMAVPSDIEELDISFEDESPRPIVIEQVWFDDDEEESIYSQPSFVPAQESIHPISPAVSETPINEMYLPRASTDSDTSRSSLDSFSSSCHSSSSESSPISPFSFPPTPAEKTHQLRSRWSCSTISSFAPEPPRTLLSPLRGVFGSRTKRPPPIMSTPPRTRVSPTNTPTPTPNRAQSPYKMPLTRMVFPATPSPPSTPQASPSRHIRRQNSRSSTSSAAWSECDSCESGGSGSGLRRKPIPVEMFLRA